MGAGTLITIEGVDGAGKTTLATALAERLGARPLREPGGVALAERLRALAADPAFPTTPRAEALLYLAARAQLVEELLRPALAAGETVVLDRFSDSTLAYQGAGRGLGVEEMRRLDRFATGGLVPARTLLLRLPVAAAAARLADRSAAASRERLEGEPGEFFEAIAAAYDELAAAEPGRFRVLDATQPPEGVLDAALEAVADLTGD